MKTDSSLQSIEKWTDSDIASISKTIICDQNNDGTFRHPVITPVCIADPFLRTINKFVRWNWNDSGNLQSSESDAISNLSPFRPSRKDGPSNVLLPFDFPSNRETLFSTVNILSDFYPVLIFSAYLFKFPNRLTRWIVSFDLNVINDCYSVAKKYLTLPIFLRTENCE
jgi:hypothetical protein